MRNSKYPYIDNMSELEVDVLIAEAEKIAESNGTEDNLDEVDDQDDVLLLEAKAAMLDFQKKALILDGLIQRVEYLEGIMDDEGFEEDDIDTDI